MKPFISMTSTLERISWLCAVVLLAANAQAQSFCASDDLPRPVQLMERFINADCSDCWTDPATPKSGANEIALDWVIPGTQGDDAPLSAVATRDALDRLALLETLPAGTEGSPVERNLVRNMLSRTWDGHKQLSKNEQNRLFETRSMNIAPAASPNRLRVIGWVEDEQGQVLAAAQSRCAAP